MEKILAALADAGLPKSPFEAMQKQVLISEGEHEDDHIIVADITGIGFAPEEGLTLRISYPQFKGLNVVCLRHKESMWLLYLGDNSAIQVDVRFTSRP